VPSKAKTRGTPRSVFVRRWVAVGALLLVGLLYYRPLKAYVDALRAEHARLRHRLGASTSLVTLAREARALGYVKPGEHLFIVKGINDWRKRERASLSRP
jgi:hypothetical protein